MKDRKQKPLYRKVNTRTRRVIHNSGGDYRHDRNRKRPGHVTMAKGVKRGLDYTPLFRFLLAKVGGDWTEIYREAAARLDSPDPIFWMVALNEADRKGIVRVGESAYFSGLYVDEDDKLQIVAPEIGPEQLEPGCACCTHTLNGIPFQKPYRGISGGFRALFLNQFYPALCPPLDENRLTERINDWTAVWRNVFGAEPSPKSLAKVTEAELERLRDECRRAFQCDAITTEQVRAGISRTLAMLDPQNE